MEYYQPVIRPAPQRIPVSIAVNPISLPLQGSSYAMPAKHKASLEPRAMH